MQGTTFIARGTVVQVADYPAITFKDAGSAEGAPAIPRKLVTFRRDERLYGGLDGTTFQVVQPLAPGGAVFPENPEFKVGERALLFLRPTMEPDGTAAKTPALSMVGIDGRYRIASSGEIDAMLDGAPIADVRAAARQPSRFEEATR